MEVNETSEGEALNALKKMKCGNSFGLGRTDFAKVKGDYGLMA